MRNERIALESKDVRKLILKTIAVRKGTISDIEKIMKVIDSKHSFLRPLLKWLVIYYDLNVFDLQILPPVLAAFFRAISSISPVCSYVKKEMVFLCEKNVKEDRKLWEALQQDLPVFFDLLKDMPVDVSLPDCFKGILLH